jgi:hypothetical protein
MMDIGDMLRRPSLHGSLQLRASRYCGNKGLTRWGHVVGVLFAVIEDLDDAEEWI